MTILRGAVAWLHGRSEIVRVSIVAVIGTVLAWATYEIVYMLNALEPRPTTSWAIAFFIGIFRQHHLHRTLSFPTNGLSYLGSLKRDFVASIGIAVLSTGFNYLLTQAEGFHHRLAWVSCVVFVAAVEYLLMKFFVFPRKEQDRSKLRGMSFRDRIRHEVISAVRAQAHHPPPPTERPDDRPC